MMMLDSDARAVIRDLRRQGWEDELIARAFEYQGHLRAARAYLSMLDREPGVHDRERRADQYEALRTTTRIGP